LINQYVFAALLRRVIDGMARVAQEGGDTRGLTIILNMRAAVDDGDIALCRRWMAILERHAGQGKYR